MWFPGAGKTKILKDLLSNKKILKSYLEKLYGRVKFIEYSGIETENSSHQEILNSILSSLSNSKLDNSDQLNQIISNCQQLIDQGYEVVLVGNELEILSEKEYEKTLTSIARIVLANKTRIHSILNIKNKNMFNKALERYSFLLSIANKIETVPVLSEQLLSKYIKEKATYFEKKMSPSEAKRIENYTGGILLLTKELIRNYPEEGELDLKLVGCCKHLSKKALELLTGQIKTFGQEVERTEAELKRMRIWGLGIFTDKINLLESNPRKTLKRILTDKENTVITHLSRNKGRLLTKENVALKIWGKKDNIDYSDWAVDQFISRLRKKLAKAGIDPEVLKTVKGRGYKWNY